MTRSDRITTSACRHETARSKPCQALRTGLSDPERGLFTTSGARDGRGPTSGGGVRSGCVTRSPESQPCGLRAGRGGPTPPERTPPPAATRPVTRAAFVNNQPRYPHCFARKSMETGAQRRDVAIRAWLAANEYHQGSRRQARLRLAWSASDGESYRGGATAMRCFGCGGMIQPARGSKSFSRKRLQRKGVRSKSAERPCRITSERMSPMTGECLNPCPLQPKSTYSPSYSGTAPRTG